MQSYLEKISTYINQYSCKANLTENKNDNIKDATQLNWLLSQRAKL